MSDSLRPHGLYSPWNSSPGQNTAVGSLSLLPGGLPNPGIKPRSPAWQADSFPAEPQGKPKNTGVGSLSLLQRIFPTQRSNQGLLHYRRILYQLNYQGSPSNSHIVFLLEAFGGWCSISRGTFPMVLCLAASSRSSGLSCIVASSRKLPLIGLLLTLYPIHTLFLTCHNSKLHLFLLFKTTVSLIRLLSFMRSVFLLYLFIGVSEECMGLALPWA